MAFAQDLLHLLPEWLIKESPVEVHATCDKCIMQCGSRIGPRIPKPYGAAKCCTYQPNLSNYSVGGLLDDQSPSLAEGRKRIADRINSRIGVFPIGIRRSRRYEILYESSQTWFGRADSMVCPYYNAGNGGCSIWSHRNPVCSTWFCVYSDGHDGYLFWSSVRGYLNWLDTALSTYALRELGWGADEILAMTSIDRLPITEYDIDEKPLPESDYRSIWRGWCGREAELYRATSEIVRRFDRRNVGTLGDLQNKLYSEELTLRLSRIRETILPERIRFDTASLLLEISGDEVIIGTCNRKYLTRIKKGIFASIQLFDGRRETAEVCRVAKEEYGFALPATLVLQLLHQRVLLDVSESYWEMISRTADQAAR